MRHDLRCRPLISHTHSILFRGSSRPPPLPWVGRGEERGLRLPGEGRVQAACDSETKHNGCMTDPVPGYAGFAAALREAGVPCDGHRVQAYLAAVGEVDIAEPTQLYWAGRLTLCSSPDDLP